MNKRTLVLVIGFFVIVVALIAVGIVSHHRASNSYHDISLDREKIENSSIAYICDPEYVLTEENLDTFLEDDLTAPAMLYFGRNGESTYRCNDSRGKEKFFDVLHKGHFVLMEIPDDDTITEDFVYLNNVANRIWVWFSDEKTFLRIFNMKDYNSSHVLQFVAEGSLKDDVEKVLSEVAASSKVITDPDELTQFE